MPRRCGSRRLRGRGGGADRRWPAGCLRIFPTRSWWRSMCPPTHRACWPRSSTATDRCRDLGGQRRDALEPGRIYVAVPDRHLLVDDHGCAVAGSDGERPPARDQRSVPIGRAALRAARRRGVDLGCARRRCVGAAAIRSSGGTTVAQDPRGRLVPDHAAQRACRWRHRPPGGGRGDRHAAQATDPSARRGAGHGPRHQHGAGEPDRDGRAVLDDVRVRKARAPSGYTCPDCNGSLIR